MDKKETERVKEVRADVARYKKISAIANQEGGKVILSLCIKDIVTAIDTIAGNYKELSHAEFIAQGARLAERLNLYRLVKGSRKNQKLAEEELKIILEEESD